MSIAHDDAVIERTLEAVDGAVSQIKADGAI
jgi:hypothetical protein